jgi:hypothetical protein
MDEKPYLVIKALSKKATAVAEANVVGQTERNTIIQIASVLDMLVILYSQDVAEIEAHEPGFIDGIKKSLSKLT